MADVFAVASKEFSDIVRSKRFIILVVIFGLIMMISIATVYVQRRPYETSVEIDGEYVPIIRPPRRFLGEVGYTLSGILSVFAPVMGVALGCDAISGEREKGTLKLVLSQSVYRDTVINGKFVAATSALSLAILITSLASVGSLIIVIGVTPTAQEALRIALFLLFSILFTMTYYGVSIFLSIISKKTSQSVILSVALWMVFTFAISIIATLIAWTIAPPYLDPEQEFTSPSDVGTWARFRTVVEAISSVSPNYHFNKISQYLILHIEFTMTPGGPVEWVEPSVMTSLINAGPNILVLLIMTALAFIFSYITFTRQEVR